ncbi:unnamed protein product [Closterium sp. NIES-54]
MAGRINCPLEAAVAGWMEENEDAARFRDLDISDFANANDFGDAARPNFENAGLASFHNATVFGISDVVSANFGTDLAVGDSDGSLVPWDPDVDDVDQTFYPFVIEPRRPPPGVPFDPAGAPRPSNEEFRLQVLRRFAILDTVRRPLTFSPPSHSHPSHTLTQPPHTLTPHSIPLTLARSVTRQPPHTYSLNPYTPSPSPPLLQFASFLLQPSLP